MARRPSQSGAPRQSSRLQPRQRLPSTLGPLRKQHEQQLLQQQQQQEEEQGPAQEAAGEEAADGGGESTPVEELELGPTASAASP